MLKAIALTLGLALGFCIIVKAQTSSLPSVDSLKRAVIELGQEIYEVKLNLHNSQNS